MKTFKEYIAEMGAPFDVQVHPDLHKKVTVGQNLVHKGQKVKVVDKFDDKDNKKPTLRLSKI